MYVFVISVFIESRQWLSGQNIFQNHGIFSLCAVEASFGGDERPEDERDHIYTEYGGETEIHSGKSAQGRHCQTYIAGHPRSRFVLIF